MKFERVAKEAFQILRSFDYDLVMYDEDGSQVYNPAEARRFFSKSKTILVSIVDRDEDTTLRLYVTDTVTIGSITGLISGLRTMATKYGLIFNVARYEKSAILPRDFANVSVNESVIAEGMYGTSRSSYVKLENARIIVRHTSPVNEAVPGARGRQIERIYIENKAGERMLFPTRMLPGARALAHHVSNGGTWNDAVGAAIREMATDYANLRVAAGHARKQHVELDGLLARLFDAMAEIRRTFEAFCKRSRYEAVRDEIANAKILVEKSRIEAVRERLGDLSEDVLISVARRLKDEPVETVSVMGHPVDRAAWERLKNGEITLTAGPPIVMSDDLVADLAGLAERTEDPSLAGLLTHVAGRLGGSRTAKAERLARHALTVAGAVYGPSGVSWSPSEVVMTPEVRDLAEWLSQPVEALAEDELELDASDFVHPVDPGEDFKREVEVPVTQDGEIPDNNYAAKLQNALARNK